MSIVQIFIIAIIACFAFAAVCFVLYLCKGSRAGKVLAKIGVLMAMLALVCCLFVEIVNKDMSYRVCEVEKIDDSQRVHYTDGWGKAKTAGSFTITDGDSLVLDQYRVNRRGDIVSHVGAAAFISISDLPGVYRETSPDALFWKCLSCGHRFSEQAGTCPYCLVEGTIGIFPRAGKELPGLAGRTACPGTRAAGPLRESRQDFHMQKRFPQESDI